MDVVQTVYVVMGSTGEYSDRREWAVAAYTDEKEVQRHVIEAEKRAGEIKVLSQSEGKWPHNYSNDFDKGFDMDYTGTSYYYTTVELFGDILEYKLTI